MVSDFIAYESWEEHMLAADNSRYNFKCGSLNVSGYDYEFK